jgi:hypothetical protein
MIAPAGKPPTIMNRKELDAIHSSSENWYLHFFYFAPADPRIIAKKRHGIGWTLNFARPLAIPTLLVMIGAIWGTFWLASCFNLSKTVQWGLVFAVFVSLSLCCGWMANPDRQGSSDD